MADNITVEGGDVSTEEVTTLNGSPAPAQHVQRVAISRVTANGTVLDVTSTNPMPITGVVALPSGASSDATLAAMSAKLPASLGAKASASSLSVVPATGATFDVNVTGGSSAGTEYTEDAASAANPAGGMLIARRRDTLSASEVSADGDNIALNATSKGELRVALDADSYAALAALSGYATVGYSLTPSAAASTNLTLVKASGGAVVGVYADNTAAYDVFLKLYDAAATASVTVGTTVPKAAFRIRAGTSFRIEPPFGLTFSTGIVFALTKLVATSDTTVLVAGDISPLNIVYT